MSRSGHADASVPPAGHRVWTIDIDPDDERQIREHVHDMHELLWGSTGTRTVEIDHEVWIVPPTIGVWIPAGTPHGGHVSNRAGYRCTFFDVHLGRGPDRPAAIPITPAWRELVLHLRRPDLDRARRRRAEHVAVDLAEPQRAPTVSLPLPRDDRLRQIADALLADPGADADLSQWGRRTGASVRTLTRRFSAETGFTFAEWRAHARARAALVHLANGTSVAHVARLVGYRTTSAFVRAFKATTGQTPGTYVSGTSTHAVHLDERPRTEGGAVR